MPPSRLEIVNKADNAVYVIPSENDTCFKDQRWDRPDIKRAYWSLWNDNALSSLAAGPTEIHHFLSWFLSGTNDAIDRNDTYDCLVASNESHRLCKH